MQSITSFLFLASSLAYLIFSETSRSQLPNTHAGIVQVNDAHVHKLYRGYVRLWQVESNRPISKQNRRLLDGFDENRVNGNKANQTKTSTTLLVVHNCKNKQ